MATRILSICGHEFDRMAGLLTLQTRIKLGGAITGAGQLINLGRCVARPESSKGVDNRSHALPFGPGRATQELLQCEKLSSPVRKGRDRAF